MVLLGPCVTTEHSQPNLALERFAYYSVSHQGSERVLVITVFPAASDNDTPHLSVLISINQAALKHS